MPRSHILFNAHLFDLASGDHTVLPTHHEDNPIVFCVGVMLGGVTLDVWCLVAFSGEKLILI